MTVDQYQAAVGLYSSSSPRLTRLGTNRLLSTVGMNRHGHGVVCAPRSGRVIVVVRTVTVNSSRHVDQLRVATVQCQQRHTRGSTDCTVTTTSSSRRLMEALADRLHRPLCIHTHSSSSSSSNKWSNNSDQRPHCRSVVTKIDPSPGEGIRAPPNTWFLGPRDSTPQTASRSVRPF